MKKSILLSCFFVITLSAHSQSYDGEPFVPYDPVFMTYSVTDLFANYRYHVQEVMDNDLKIEGSPYVFREFKPGIVYSKKEKAAFHLDLNINAYNNKFDFIYMEDIFEMPNFAFDSVLIDRDKFIPVSIVEDDRVKIYSMQVLEEDTLGNYLLKKNIIKFIDKKPAKAYQMAEPAQFKSFPPEYYLYNTELELIPLNKLKSLAEYQNMPQDIDVYIRKNHIKTRQEESLRRLFYHIYAER